MNSNTVKPEITVDESPYDFTYSLLLPTGVSARGLLSYPTANQPLHRVHLSNKLCKQRYRGGHRQHSRR